jgi:nicotinic acid mononucleotide adenylyltransferase
MARVGFFPIIADPIHTGYLAAAKSAQEYLNLDTIYIQICRDSDYKPNKADKRHRRKMAEIAIQECEPISKYAPIGFDNTLWGEDLFIEFVNNPPNQMLKNFI